MSLAPCRYQVESGYPVQGLEPLELYKKKQSIASDQVDPWSEVYPFDQGGGSQEDRGTFSMADLEAICGSLGDLCRLVDSVLLRIGNGKAHQTTIRGPAQSRACIRESRPRVGFDPGYAVPVSGQHQTSELCLVAPCTILGFSRGHKYLFLPVIIEGIATKHLTSKRGSAACSPPPPFCASLLRFFLPFRSFSW